LRGKGRILVHFFRLSESERITFEVTVHTSLCKRYRLRIKFLTIDFSQCIQKVVVAFVEVFTADKIDNCAKRYGHTPVEQQ